MNNKDNKEILLKAIGESIKIKRKLDKTIVVYHDLLEQLKVKQKQIDILMGEDEGE